MSQNGSDESREKIEIPGFINLDPNKDISIDISHSNCSN